MNEPGVLGRIRRAALTTDRRLFVAVEPDESRALVAFIDELQGSLFLEFGCVCEPWKRTGGVHAHDCALCERETPER